MKLSAHTISILKNFATINSSLMVKKGDKLNTCCPSNRTLGEAQLTDSFPQEFGIYDLSKFLGVLSMFKNPNIEFTDTHMVISAEGAPGRSVKYFYTNPDFIKNKGDKKIRMPDLALTFNLSSEDMDAILKAAAILQAPDVCIESKEGKLGIRVCDKKESTSNSWYLDMNTETDVAFAFWFSVDNMKLISDDYEIAVGKSQVVRFKGSQGQTYWVAMESDSTYGG